MVRTPNPFDEFRILTVVPAPLIVTVLEGPVNVEPAPEVSQFPATAHVPEAVIVPEVPPVIVTLATLTVEVPAVNVAPLFTVRLPPVPVKARFAVARFALLFRVSVPPHRSAFVAIVNVAAAVGLNCTLLNSEKPRLPNVMVREAPELKTTVPVPADHDPLVDEFVQEPLKVHVAPPKLTNPVAAMLTLPLIVFVPAAPAVSPPAIFAASVAAVSVNVLLARTAPAFTVRMPPLPTFNAPPVNPRLAVARAVVDDPSETISVPAQFRALVDIVKVCADAAEESNVMLLNSLPERFAPANVIVPPVALLKVTVPVPAPHVADVEAFVHVPVIVHVDEFITR